MSRVRKRAENVFFSSYLPTIVISSGLGDILDDEDDYLDDIALAVEDLLDGPEYLMMPSMVHANKSPHLAGRKQEPYKGNLHSYLKTKRGEL